MKSYGKDITSIETENSLEADSYVKTNSSPTSEKTDLTINHTDESNDNISSEKSYNRDSGFHTMTRHPCNDEASINLSSASASPNGIMTSQAYAVEVNDTSITKLHIEHEIEQLDRSSPVITRKYFQFSEKSVEDEDASNLALKLFNLEGNDKHDVAKHLSNK